MLVVVFKFIVFALLMIVCAMLLLLVLMQRPKQEGLGAAFGAQMTDQAFGARTTDVLKKGTIFFGSLFMILCFLLSVLIQNEHSNETMKNVASAPAKTQTTTVEQTKTTETAKTEVTAPVDNAQTPADTQQNVAGDAATAETAQTPTEAQKEEAPTEEPAAQQ